MAAAGELPTAAGVSPPWGEKRWPLLPIVRSDADGGQLRDNGLMDDRPLDAAPFFEPALEALARSWNRLDPELLAPWLAESVRYESPATDFYLSGRQAVMDYLHRKVQRIEEAGGDARIRAELGWVATARSGRRECVISSQGEVERAALFLVALAADRRIERIEVSTCDPDPRLAEGSGVVPR
jgi:hypothetical protein